MGAGKDGHLTGGLTNQKARLDHVTSAKHVLGSRCRSVEDAGPVHARLSESVGRRAATPAGLRGSFKSQPRQA